MYFCCLLCLEIYTDSDMVNCGVFKGLHLKHIGQRRGYTVNHRVDESIVVYTWRPIKPYYISWSLSSS